MSDHPHGGGGGRGGGRWSMPDRPASKNLGTLRQTWRFMRPYLPQLSIAAVALVVTALATLSIGVGLKYVIDQGLTADSRAMLDQGLLAMVAIILVISVGTYFRFYFVSWVGERVVADIRTAVFSQVLKLSPGFYEVTKTGEILSRLTSDTAVLQTVIGSSLSIALRNSLSLVGGIVMLLITNAQLTGIVALVVPAVVVPIIWYGRRVRKLSRASQDRIADVGAYGEEALNAIRTVQAYTHEDIDRAKFAKEVEGAFDVAMKRIFARGMLGSVVILLVFGAIGVVLWTGGRGVIDGTITAGELTAFIFYAMTVAVAVGTISEVLGDLQRAAGATERLVELLETPPEIRAPANPAPMPEPARGEVEFDRVTFHYPSRPDAAALHDFSLKVNAGEHLALVGPSGAGKRTVFQLILRFYDPQAGAVRLDGVDLKQADPRAARARIGLVSQDPVIFSSNALENIRYGRPEASDAEVRAAAEAAQALEFIEKLPDGFNSFLGEKGVRLSGGQKQRIAIARAILADPALLLLDEATSALDAENERLVQKAIERLIGGRTTMVIAHRLATVVNADRIAVIDQGRLIDTGRHDQLLRANPMYARLAALQFNTDPGPVAMAAAQ
ncbi:MAG: ABC transporter transmembrane domain-containing protein [Rhodospirillaceae bacterium]|nr:ABC transporter transmembrane domain-containing protein [Rhodospirillaceae bacterium]